MKASANGFILDCKGAELAASWAAPYFVLVPGEHDDEPMLIHCDDLAHAQRSATCWDYAIILEHDFRRYCVQPWERAA